MLKYYIKFTEKGMKNLKDNYYIKIYFFREILVTKTSAKIFVISQKIQLHFRENGESQFRFNP
jgi:hypothetical protein